MLTGFLPRYNSRFAVLPSQPGSAYRRPGTGFNPEEGFCFKYQRTVGQDNVVRFEEHRFQIEPGNSRPSYAHARVEVHERMDGSLAVYHQGHCLTTKPAPLEAPVLRARHATRVMPEKRESPEITTPASLTQKAEEPKKPYHPKPAPNHPWRRGYKIHLDRG